MGYAMLFRPVLTAVFAAAVFFAGPASAVEIQQLTSPKGIKFWYERQADLPIVAVSATFVNAGAATLPLDKEGLAYLVSILLDEGAGDMVSAKFQAYADEINIDMDFNAGTDNFDVGFRTLSSERDNAFKLVGLALTQPRFDAEAVERMRENQLDDLNRRQASAGDMLNRAWAKAAFGDHPYGRNIRGNPSTVEKFTVADLRDFVATRFTRDKLVIGAVGDVDAAEISRLIDLAYGGLPATGPRLDPPELVVTPPTDRDDITIVRQNIPQSTVIFGTRGLKRDDPDYYAAALLNNVLGGSSFMSRLWDAVRAQRGLAYSVATFINPMQHSSYFMGQVGTNNDQVKLSYDLIRSEIDRVAREGVTQKELDDARSYVLGSFAMSMDTNRRLAGVLASIQIAQLGPDYIDHRADFYGKVTLDDIKRVARRLFWGDPNATEGTVRLITAISGNPTGFDKAN